MFFGIVKMTDRRENSLNSYSHMVSFVFISTLAHFGCNHDSLERGLDQRGRLGTVHVVVSRRRLHLAAAAVGTQNVALFPHSDSCSPHADTVEGPHLKQQGVSRSP